MNEEPVLYFCSDDGGVRNGLLSIEDVKVQCVSLLSSFQRMKEDGVLTAETVAPYVEAILGYFGAHNQKTIRVVENTPIGRYVKVPCNQVFQEIFDGRFRELPNGMLKYWTRA